VLKKYKEALADFTKTIELIPKDADAYNDRGEANFNLGNYTDAVNDFKKAVKLVPNNQLYIENLRVATTKALSNL